MDIFISVCESVAFMHDNKMIHRDIKPENILLDDDLQPKLCDFGWSIELKKNEKRQTFCGTYEYMAPEIFESENYYSAVDVWSLGILLYELFHGTSPFVGNSIFSIYKNIIKESIKFSDDFDPLGKQLVTQILKLNPAERPTVKEILNHPFIQNHKNSAWSFVPRLGHDHLVLEDDHPNDDIVVTDCNDSPIQKTQNKHMITNSSKPPTLFPQQPIQPKQKSNLPKPSPTNIQTAHVPNDSLPKSNSSQKKTVFKLNRIGGLPNNFGKSKDDPQRNFKKQQTYPAVAKDPIAKSSNIIYQNCTSFPKKDAHNSNNKQHYNVPQKQTQPEQTQAFSAKICQSNNGEVTKFELANLYHRIVDTERSLGDSKCAKKQAKSSSVDSQKKPFDKRSSDKKAECEESTEFSRVGLNLGRSSESLTDDCAPHFAESNKCLLNSKTNNIYTRFKDKHIESCFGIEQSLKSEQQAFKLDKQSLFSSKNRVLAVSKAKKPSEDPPKQTPNPAFLSKPLCNQLNKSLHKNPLHFDSKTKDAKNSLFNKQPQVSKGSLWKYMKMDPSVNRIRKNSLDLSRNNAFKTFTNTNPSFIESNKHDKVFKPASIYQTTHSLKRDQPKKSDSSEASLQNWRYMAHKKTSIDSPTELLESCQFAGMVACDLGKDTNPNGKTVSNSHSNDSFLLNQMDFAIQAPRNSQTVYDEIVNQD
jgi:serine/threonine protein kinase